jgi:ABC-type Mn2+/Zn2+ transport system ATPase subunit
MIEFVPRRGTFDAEPIITQNGKRLRILKDCGGSMQSVVGNALRIVFLLLCRPPLQRVLILDESAEGVDAIHLEAFMEFLSQVAERTGTQIICISHQPALEAFADKVIHLEKGLNGVAITQEGGE